MSNKEVGLRFYQDIDLGDTANIARLCAADATFQFGSGPAISLEYFNQQIAAMPPGSTRHTPRDLVAEGDKVACHVDVMRRIDGVESVNKAMTLFTFAGGKIASELVILDAQAVPV